MYAYCIMLLMKDILNVLTNICWLNFIICKCNIKKPNDFVTLWPFIINRQVTVLLASQMSDLKIAKISFDLFLNFHPLPIILQSSMATAVWRYWPNCVLSECLAKNCYELRCLAAGVMCFQTIQMALNIWCQSASYW